MNISNKKLLILFFASLLLSLNTFAKNNLTFSEKDVELSSEIIGVLENNHFTKKKYPSIKTEALKEYIKRLDPNKPSYTVTGSGGGGTHVYHWKENRALTNRERARLQTFPDNFIFEGSKESVRKQIGMAVPVKGAKILFDSILKTFEGIDYPSIDGKF